MKNLGTPRNHHKNWGKKWSPTVDGSKNPAPPAMYKILSIYKSWDKTTKLNWCRFFLINSRKWSSLFCLNDRREGVFKNCLKVSIGQRVDWLTCCKLWPDVASYRMIQERIRHLRRSVCEKAGGPGVKTSEHLDMGVQNISKQVSCYIVSADRTSSEFIPFA